MGGSGDEVEPRIRALAMAGQLHDACELGVRAYGAEVMSYLVAITQAADDAAELFAALLLKVWAALPDFRWECSFRTWIYTIARRLHTDHLRGAARRRRDRRLSSVQHQLVAEVRSTVPPFAKSEVQRRLREVRGTLDPDDQTLLILRVDRKLSWPEIARVMLDHDVAPDELAKAAAALRKRFQRLKEELKRRLE